MELVVWIDCQQEILKFIQFFFELFEKIVFFSSCVDISQSLEIHFFYCVENMTEGIHSCKTNKCTGSAFDGEYLRCIFCKEEYYIECLSKCKDSKKLLQRFNLIDNHDNPVLVNIKTVMAHFKIYFSVTSAFGITCLACKNKFTTINSKLDREIEKNRSQERAIAEDKSEIARLTSEVNNLNDNIEQLQAKQMETSEQLKSTSDTGKSIPIRNQSALIETFGAKIVELIQNTIKTEIESIPSTTNQTNRPSQDVVPVNGTFAIHISKALKNTTTEDITDLIVSKSNLSAQTFKVEKLTSRRYRGKNREFSSFKISTFTREIFNKIINDEIWKPDCVAKPFIYKDSTVKHNTPNRYDTNAPKTNKIRSEHAAQGPNANVNSHGAPRPKNNTKNHHVNSNIVNNNNNNNKHIGNFALQQTRQTEKQQQQHQKLQPKQQQQQGQPHRDTFNTVNPHGYDTERVTQQYSGAPFGSFKPAHHRLPQLQQYTMPSPIYAPNFLPFRGFQPMYPPF